MDACATILGISVDELVGRSRRWAAVEARGLIVSLGREGWGRSTNELATVLGKSVDTVTYLTREGVNQRLEHDGFARRYEALDSAVIAHTQQDDGGGERSLKNVKVNP